MKKKLVKTALVALVAMIAMPQAAAAQGLGGLLKKAKKAVETVTEVTGTATGLQTVDIPGGGTIQNPIAADIDIVPVGLYGVSTSENYGYAYLVLKVKMNLNKTKVNFGTVKSEWALAIDENGDVHKIDAGGSYPYDVVEGSYVNIRLDYKDIVFPDVKKSAKVMQQVKMGVFIDANHWGVLTMKNVPIQWDVEP